MWVRLVQHISIVMKLYSPFLITKWRQGETCIKIVMVSPHKRFFHVLNSLPIAGLNSFESTLTLTKRINILDTSIVLSLKRYYK